MCYDFTGIIQHYRWRQLALHDSNLNVNLHIYIYITSSREKFVRIYMSCFHNLNTFNLKMVSLIDCSSSPIGSVFEPSYLAMSDLQVLLNISKCSLTMASKSIVSLTNSYSTKTSSVASKPHFFLNFWILLTSSLARPSLFSSE
ncbi:hypothetical protein B6A09_0155 [Saccharomyces cerevisiae synthetic construct]|uniref:Putative uncharacterized protein YBL077W n=2 Tax=Saccharomyces cerevisiae TaxID=4932 RepID=YBH7_YEAST|nr:RecName: Full=Putative uncharacterized protein YBL077W [Saccharomyces cerevisiae S288C]ARB01706.1 hypothetical protein B6A09_0155 [Saccharomyces cerevisiae synthetic construct]KZV12989.1 hypothetical protein WN66_00166 [Saccharomyces cerevisiae]CAY77707.1 EC1118_1B15_0353p [Saccharomyces cerevisiae EC1118]WNV71804.1 hypothetical protein O6U65_0031 [Saccharomyces cerevisiae synthetic construct]CAA56033.1 A-143 protein [Saccharomyces cerevisiae]